MTHFPDSTPHEEYLAFQKTIIDAEQAAAVHNLQSEFEIFHATNIAPLDASVRCGAIALLAATGTQVEHGTYYGGKDRIYSSGFLVTGDIESDEGNHTASVVRLSTQAKSSWQYNGLLGKSFQRDRRLSLPITSRWHIGRITKTLQQLPIEISAGTIFNHEPADERAVPFVQATARQMRPETNRGGSASIVIPNFIERRLLGEVITGYYAQSTPFAGESSRLTTQPTDTLPRIIPSSEVDLLNLAYSSADKRREYFGTRLEDAVHNEQAARALFEGTSMAATRMAHKKLGRLFWNGDSSLLQKFRLTGQRKPTANPLAAMFQERPEID